MAFKKRYGRLDEGSLQADLLDDFMRSFSLCNRYRRGSAPGSTQLRGIISMRVRGIVGSYLGVKHRPLPFARPGRTLSALDAIFLLSCDSIPLEYFE